MCFIAVWSEWFNPHKLQVNSRTSKQKNNRERGRGKREKEREKMNKNILNTETCLWITSMSTFLAKYLAKASDSYRLVDILINIEYSICMLISAPLFDCYAISSAHGWIMTMVVVGALNHFRCWCLCCFYILLLSIILVYFGLYGMHGFLDVICTKKR